MSGAQNIRCSFFCHMPAIECPPLIKFIAKKMRESINNDEFK